MCVCVQFSIVRVMFEQRLISLSLSLYILFVCFVLLRSLLTDRSLAPFILFILLSYPILSYAILSDESYTIDRSVVRSISRGIYDHIASMCMCLCIRWLLLLLLLIFLLSFHSFFSWRFIREASCDCDLCIWFGEIYIERQREEVLGYRIVVVVVVLLDFRLFRV